MLLFISSYGVYVCFNLHLTMTNVPEHWGQVKSEYNLSRASFRCTRRDSRRDTRPYRKAGLVGDVGIVGKVGILDEEGRKRVEVGLDRRTARSNAVYRFQGTRIHSSSRRVSST